MRGRPRGTSAGCAWSDPFGRATLCPPHRGRPQLRRSCLCAFLPDARAPAASRVDRQRPLPWDGGKTLARSGLPAIPSGSLERRSAPAALQTPPDPFLAWIGMMLRTSDADEWMDNEFGLDLREIIKNFEN